MGGWYNGRINLSVEVKTSLLEHRKRLETRRIPPDAPELGPTEQIWGALSDQRLASWRPKISEEVWSLTEKEMDRMQRHPDPVAFFIRYSGLPRLSLP